MQAINKKTVLLATLPIIGIGWYLFRPELLFIDQKVADKAPAVGSAGTKTVATGKFASFSHETEGQAQIISGEKENILRLEGLKTSNGPDVHVYLVKGNDPKDIKEGSFLDLGSLKGNVGDQNYTIPTGTNLEEYKAVNIWCKRFSVGFGGATLSGERISFKINPRDFHFTSFASDILVTSGNFSLGATGQASLIEKDGKRFIKVSNLKAGKVKDAELHFVKAE